MLWVGASFLSMLFLHFALLADKHEKRDTIIASSSTIPFQHFHGVWCSVDRKIVTFPSSILWSLNALHDSFSLIHGKDRRNIITFSSKIVFSYRDSWIQDPFCFLKKVTLKNDLPEEAKRITN
jgi:hypothetical protein